MQFSPGVAPSRNGVRLAADLLFDHQQLVGAKNGSRFARMFEASRYTGGWPAVRSAASFSIKGPSAAIMRGQSAVFDGFS